MYEDDILLLFLIFPKRNKYDTPPYLSDNNSNSMRFSGISQ